MSLIAKQLNIPSPNGLRLNNVSCDIKPGQLTALVGPNGCGKTTLLRCLSGDIKPHNGTVSLDQQRLDLWPFVALAQRRAVLPQKTELNFPFKTQAVVALGRSPFKSHQQHDFQRIRHAMQQFDISHLKNRCYTTLSGGEQQRVQLARVWVQINHDTLEQKKLPPSYLLLDEPNTALDLKHQISLMQLIHELTHQHNTGVVAALHDLSIAARFADHIILLNNGAVVAAGRPQDVLNQKNIEHVYAVEVDFIRYPRNKKTPIIIPEMNI